MNHKPELEQTEPSKGNINWLHAEVPVAGTSAHQNSLKFSYGLLFSVNQYRFLIDEIPIRVFTNNEEKGIPYPKDQAMAIYSSVWNADDWATEGGRVKTDWNHAPFVTAFRSFNIDACEFLLENEKSAGKCRVDGEFWWDKPAMSGLNLHQSHQLKWVRAKHLVYDYCKDTMRFCEPPKECFG